ncbi:MAG: hypothetical protein H6664_10425 [Ardenticatenaceae bacterium]|nr:hypothetical protein [Ardenticatenaceae bacterium]
MPPLLVEAGILEAGGDIAYAARALMAMGISMPPLLAMTTYLPTQPPAYGRICYHPTTGRLLGIGCPSCHRLANLRTQSPIILGGGFVVVLFSASPLSASYKPI